jgi:flagellar hook protein FlgE
VAAGREPVQQALFGNSQIAAGGSSASRETRAPATASTLLTEAYNLNGQSLNLTAGSSTLQIDGSLNSQGITPRTLAVGAGTTLGDLLSSVQVAFNLTTNPVTLDDDGRIFVQGDVGLANALGDIVISEVGTTNSALNTATQFTQTQQARDASDFSVATAVYDSLGAVHTVRFVFTKIAGLNEWTWQAAMEGGEVITNGGSGRVRFTSEGLISSFTFNDGSNALSFLPQPTGTEGALPVTVQLDVGDIGGVNGLTQFVANGSLQSLADGYTRGELVDFEIDQNGIISGRFSNDTIRTLGQVALATFSNPAGLMREASNTYKASGNSGEPLVTYAGITSGLSLAPGTLESSNVDLAEEFTRLVIAQRAFQANARVITTGDQVLQEMVSILR